MRVESCFWSWLLNVNNTPTTQSSLYYLGKKKVKCGCQKSEQLSHSIALTFRVVHIPEPVHSERPKPPSSSEIYVWFTFDEAELTCRVHTALLFHVSFVSTLVYCFVPRPSFTFFTPLGVLLTCKRNAHRLKLHFRTELKSVPCSDTEKKQF